MFRTLFLSAVVLLSACGQSSSGSKNRSTEIVMDLFTGYQSGRYISQSGEKFGVSTGGPTALDVWGLDNDFCLLLWGPSGKIDGSDVEFLTGIMCGKGEFGVNPWMVDYHKNDTKTLIIKNYDDKSKKYEKIMTLTYVR